MSTAFAVGRPRRCRYLGATCIAQDQNREQHDVFDRFGSSGVDDEGAKESRSNSIALAALGVIMIRKRPACTASQRTVTLPPAGATPVTHRYQGQTWQCGYAQNAVVVLLMSVTSTTSPAMAPIAGPGIFPL